MRETAGIGIKGDRAAETDVIATETEIGVIDVAANHVIEREVARGIEEIVAAVENHHSDEDNLPPESLVLVYNLYNRILRNRPSKRLAKFDLRRVIKIGITLP